MGETDRAIAALQKILSIPYSSSLASNVPLTPGRSGSIRCSIRYGMIRVFNSSPRKRQNRGRNNTRKREWPGGLRPPPGRLAD
jgi:hypothetical protein